MSNLTYRGTSHHGDKNNAQAQDAVLNYRGASHHSADSHKGKPQANRAGLRYRGVPQR
jgi:hypothetical protein